MYPPGQHLPRILPQPWATILLFSFSMNVTGGGHGNPLQHSSLENPLDRGAWWVTVRRITKSRTRLKRLTHTHATHTCTNVTLPVTSCKQFHTAFVMLCLAYWPEHSILKVHPRLAGVTVAFLFKAESCAIVCIYHIVFMHLSIYRYVGGFYLLVIMNNAAIGSGIARHMVTLCLIFGGSENYFF